MRWSDETAPDDGRKEDYGEGMCFWFVCRKYTMAWGRRWSDAPVTRRLAADLSGGVVVRSLEEAWMGGRMWMGEYL